MKREEYRDQLQLVYKAAVMLSLVDLQDIFNAIVQAETVGPILDPTLWRNNHRKMDEDRQVVEAAMPLWRLARTKLKEKLSP